MKWRVAVILSLIIFIFIIGCILYSYRDIIYEKSLNYVRNYIQKSINNIRDINPVSNITDFEKIEVDPNYTSNFFKKIYYDPLNKLKKNIKKYFRENYEIEFTIGDINLWPLNRIILNDVTIEHEEELLIDSEEIQIYYDLLTLFNDFKNWQEGLDQINVIRPKIEYTASEAPSSGEVEFEISEKLPSALGDFEIYLDQGQLDLEEKDSNIIAREISGVIETAPAGNVELNLSSHTEVQKANLGEYNLNNLDLGKMLLNFNYSRENWEARVKTDTVDLDVINEHKELLADINSGSQLDLSEIEGKGQAVFQLTGTDKDLDFTDCQGRVKVEQGAALVNYGEYIQSRQLENMNTVFSFNLANKTRFDLEQLDFVFAGNPFIFEGDITHDSNSGQISGDLFSDDFNPGKSGINLKKLEKLDLTGKSEINLNLEGDITDPEIDLDFNLPRGRSGKEEIDSLRLSLRRRENLVYLDFLEVGFNQENHLQFKGIYDYKTEKYSLDLEGESIQLALLKRNFENWNHTLYNKIDNIKEDLNGNLDLEFYLNGKGFDPDNLSGMGMAKVNSPEFGYNIFEEMESKFWLSDRKLIFNNGNILLNQGKIDFSGEYDISGEDLSFQLAGEEINSELIKNYTDTDLPAYSGKIDFNGEITESITSPSVDMELSAAEAQLMNYDFDQLTADITYQNRQLKFNNLSAVSKERSVNGSGEIDFTTEKPVINSAMKAENINYNDIKDYVEIPRSVSGHMNTDLNIEGEISSPRISGSIISDNTGVECDDRTIELDKIDMTFDREKEAAYNIKNLQVEKDDSLLNLKGDIIDNKLNLAYNLEQLDLNYLELEQSLRGLIDLEGNISGNLSDPVVDSSFEVDHLGYEDLELNSSKGKLSFRENNLELNEWDIRFGQSRYRISGKILSLIDNPELNATVEIIEGEIQPLLGMAEIDLPLAVDYKIAGGIDITGPLTNPGAEVDITGYGNDETGGDLSIKGLIEDRLDLEVTGQNILFNQEIDRAGGRINLGGKTSFRGNVSGPYDEVNLNLDTEITEGKVNNFDIHKVAGNIEVGKGFEIFLDQRIQITEDTNIDISGDMFSGEQEEMNLQAKVGRLPLNVLGEDLPILSQITGYLEGDVGFNGTLENPELTGGLYLQGEDVITELPDEINLIQGDLIFEDQSLVFSDFEGEYGNESMDVSGRLNLFDTENFWDMSLKGKNLPFSQGSFEGRIDPDITISGSLYEPQLAGDILTRDFVATMPFTWEESTSGEEEKSSDSDSNTDLGLFNPEVDLTVSPGKRVYLRESDRIDILIERGSLNLTHINQEFQITGELSSTQGSFDYYNNKFILENGRAQFRPSGDLIPRINLSAYTIVDGTRVIARLDGPADNMVTTFDSQPRLPRDEILNLLTQRGGIGGIVSGEDISIIDVISQEMLRFFREALQFDLVEDVEQDIGDIFDLDTIEIDTYDMGLDRRVNIYLGKNLTDRFYLEYSSRFNPEEREDIFSFRYDLKDNTYFRGSWDEGDYRLMLETSIDF